MRSKKRLTPAGMLTQNLYHQYLIAGLLPPDKWAHVGIFPRLTKVMLNAGVSVCVWQIYVRTFAFIHLWLTWLMLKQV